MDVVKFAADLDAQSDVFEQQARDAMAAAQDMADNIAAYVAAAKAAVLRSVAVAARAAE